MLDYSDFLELANHILRGDQVIVRGNDVTTVTSIIHVLKVRNRFFPDIGIHSTLMKDLFAVMKKTKAVAENPTQISLTEAVSTLPFSFTHSL